jgi:hypothetical protein
MNTPKPLEIFLKGTYGVSRQDKEPPRRFDGGMIQPLTAAAEPVTAKPLPENRQTHHGSETRQTLNIAGRVPLHIKTEVNRIAAVNGWTESYTVRTLVEQALAKNLGERFAVMIRNTIQEAVKTELQKGRAWLRNITLSTYLAAERTRLHTVDLHRVSLPKGGDIYQIVKDHNEQSYKNLAFYFRAIEVKDQQQSWPSLK